jgi:hypothetical protein
MKLSAVTHCHTEKQHTHSYRVSGLCPSPGILVFLVFRIPDNGQAQTVYGLSYHVDRNDSVFRHKVASSYSE